MYFKFYVAAELWGLTLVTLLILAAHGGLYAFDYWFRKKGYQHDNEVAGIIFGVLSLIYSLIIAFVIVAVWENYEGLNRTIEKEADDLNSVIVHSNMLPDSLKLSVSEALKTYCEKVINEEWDMADKIETSQSGAISSLRLLLFRSQKDSRIQPNVLSIMDDNLNSITNLHRERLSHTRAYVPELVWMILIVGSFMVICFSFFFAYGIHAAQADIFIFLWGIIGLSLFLVYMLDHPFVGSTQVSKAPYQEIINILEDM